MEIASLTVGIVGIIISLSGIDLRHWLSRLLSKDPIVGKWSAEWSSDSDGIVIRDIFEIRSCVFGNFKGTGKNESFGEYEITGHKSETSIAFTFSGTGVKKILLGSATLGGLGLLSGTLEGVWSNIGQQGNVFSGKVVAKSV